MTGSDTTIGRAAAAALSAAGIDVGITWHTDRDGAEETAAEVRSHGSRAIVAQLDGMLEELGDRCFREQRRNRHDRLVPNSRDRCDRVPGLADDYAEVRAELMAARKEARQYTRKHGVDIPAVVDWTFTAMS